MTDKFFVEVSLPEGRVEILSHQWIRKIYALPENACLYNGNICVDQGTENEKVLRQATEDDLKAFEIINTLKARVDQLKLEDDIAWSEIVI